MELRKNKMRIKNPFHFTIRGMINPPNSLLMIVFVLSNIFFFMTYEDDLQPTIQLSHVSALSPSRKEDNVKTYDFLDMETNLKYCGSPHETCKFLFVYSHPLTYVDPKPNAHIQTFSHIARLLNRTMVLPNVGHSEVSSCSHLPLDYYYNTKALRSIFPAVNFISQSEFERWTKERFRKPIAQHLHVADGTDAQSMIFQIDPPRNLSRLHSANCFDRFDMRLNRRSTHHRLLVNQDAFSDLEERKHVTKLLMKSFFHSDAEVLLVKNDISQDMSPQEYPIIPYSAHIVREAWKIKMALEPYVAIHWKMEGMRAENMHTCVERLKSMLVNIRNKYRIQNVYLSTDYPISPELAHPNSHKRFKKHHHRAMMILNSTFNVSSWVSLNAFSEMRRESINISGGNGSKNRKRSNKGSSGLEEFGEKGGIRLLDQMVCANADYFLSGPVGRNVFTQVVENFRREFLEEEGRKLLNIITSW